MLIEKRPITATFKKATGLIDWQESPDGQIVVTHASNDDLVAKRVSEIKRESNDGWSKARHFKHVARIPVMDTIAHPEILTDEKALARYLKTERGKRFKVSNL